LECVAGVSLDKRKPPKETRGIKVPTSGGPPDKPALGKERFATSTLPRLSELQASVAIPTSYPVPSFKIHGGSNLYKGLGIYLLPRIDNHAHDEKVTTSSYEKYARDHDPLNCGFNGP
jgi:hypothetical protein